MLITGTEPFSRIRDQQDDVAALERRVDLLHHLAVEPAVRFVNARSVDENNLPRRPSALRFDIQHALDARTRGLGLFRHDRHLLSNQRIQQRALARVRTANDGHKSRTERHYAVTSFGGLWGWERQTRSFCTLRSVDSRISKRSPSSSITSPGCGMRPRTALTRPPTVAVSG